MEEQYLAAEKWIKREDQAAHNERVSRLNWMVDKMPNADVLVFRGGIMSKYLFEEARYCFVYGQFLATIILSLAFIERILAALFYESGREDLKRAGISSLAQEALNTGWLHEKEYKWLEKVRKIRNPIVHFRELGVQPGENIREGWWQERIEARSIKEDRLPYDILEEDAQIALGIMYHLLGTNLLSISTL